MRPLSLQGLVTAASAAAVWLSGCSGALAFAAGLALGCSSSYLGWRRPRTAQRWGQNLLKFSIVALGAGYEWGDLCAGGTQAMVATSATLALALGLGFWLTRRWNVPRDVGLLITVGTAICGGSAIAAASPALGARSEHVGTALGVVFLLNAVALVIFPLAGRWLELDPESFGLWCALAIHDTSSVVGAASSFGDEAMEIAVLTKLGRALWIVPVVLAISVLRRQSHQATPSAARWKPPGFILAFVATAAVVQAVPDLRPWGQELAAQARGLLPLPLLALGLSLEPSALRISSGGRVTLLALALWLALSCASICWILAAPA